MGIPVPTVNAVLAIEPCAFMQVLYQLNYVPAIPESCLKSVNGQASASTLGSLYNGNVSSRHRVPSFLHTVSKSDSQTMIGKPLSLPSMPLAFWKTTDTGPAFFSWPFIPLLFHNLCPAPEEAGIAYECMCMRTRAHTHTSIYTNTTHMQYIKACTCI